MKTSEYTIEVERFKFGAGSKKKVVTGTLEYLRKYFNYTLECGQSYEHEKGNKKINMNPKSAKALVSALNKAEANRSASCQMTFFSLA